MPIKYARRSHIHLRPTGACVTQKTKLNSLHYTHMPVIEHAGHTQDRVLPGNDRISS
jgi:hypothetical protein